MFVRSFLHVPKFACKRFSLIHASFSWIHGFGCFHPKIKLLVCFDKPWRRYSKTSILLCKRVVWRDSYVFSVGFQTYLGQICFFCVVNLFLFACSMGLVLLEDANWHLSTSRRFPVNICWGTCFGCCRMWRNPTTPFKFRSAHLTWPVLMCFYLLFCADTWKETFPVKIGICQFLFELGCCCCCCCWCCCCTWRLMGLGGG